MITTVIWSPGMSLAELEKLAILKAMEFYQRDRSTVANALRIPPKTLEKKLEAYEAERIAIENHRKEQREKEYIFQMRARGTPIS